VVVEVEEQPNLHFEVGGGVATDEGARVYLRGGHRNLWGIAHRLTLYGQAGLGWVGDGWTFDTVAPEWRAAIRYEAPHTPTPGELIATDVLLNEQSQEASYRLQRSGGAFSIRVQVGPRSTAELSYGVQSRFLDDVDPGVLVAGDPWVEELSVTDLDDPSPVVPSASRLYSGIGLGLVLDRRDEVFNPTRGGIGTLSLAVSDAILSDIAFVRGEGSWTHHFRAWRLGVELRARAGGAYVADAGMALPVEDRFHVGGGGSFRGFNVGAVGPANESSGEDIDYPEALAPVVAYAGRDSASRWVPTGGDAMAVGTAEIHVPFSVFGLSGWEAWQLALFSDVGNAWWLNPGVQTDSESRGDDPLLRISAGAGIRRSTPIGPVQVDVGVNPAPLSYREEDSVRVHVSLGSL
jgi:outer membrane protein assembly factor BamA